MAILTNDEHCLIYNLHLEKHWGSTRIMKMFLNKLWSKGSIDRLIRKIDTDGRPLTSFTRVTTIMSFTLVVVFILLGSVATELR